MHFDNYAHLHQVPEKEEDGNPKLNTDFQAETVLYRQPFPQKGDFTTLGVGINIGL